MRNYALVLVALIGLGGVGCGGGKGGGAKVKGDLSVSGSPTGAVEGQVRVVLAFSKPMVQPDAVGKVVATPPLTIAPDLPREAKWTDDKTLVIVATSSLPVSTKYTVTVPGTTKALDGAVLGTSHTFEFFTERLSGTAEVVGSKQRATKDQIVRLNFNQEVAFDQLAASCGFASAKQQVKLKLAPDSNQSPAKAYTLMPDGALAMDTDWSISCKPGLKGTVGNLGIEEAIEEKFHTYGPLKFISMKPDGNDIVPDDTQPLQLAFTNPLKEPYQMKLDPEVPGFPGACNALGEPAGLSCAVLLDARTSYTLTIDAGQEDIFGQKLAKAESLAFRTTDAKPTLSLESGYFIAELKRPVVPVWGRNVTSLDVRGVQLSQANFHEMAPLLDWWESKPAEFTKSKLKPVDKKLAITGKKNQWGQHPVDPVQLFGGTPGPGMYYLEIGSSEVERSPYKDGGKQKILVNFTDIGVVSKVSGNRGVVWATQLSTGKVLPNATVTARDAQGRVTYTGTTDADGIAILPGGAKLAGNNDDRESGDYRIYVQLGNDWTMLNPRASYGLSPWQFNVSQDYEKTAAKLRGFMHTDRGLYRPGDKVHVKGIARVTKLGEPLAVPDPGKKLEVTVEGPQGKSIYQTQAKLSAFGGFWFDIDLPADARLGDYVLRAKHEYGTFTREFSVEEYRAATFEVTGKSKVAQLVRRGDFTASIAANYFYGAPVRSGEVAIAVHSRPRRVTFPAHAGFEFTDERRYSRYYYGENDYSQSLVTEDHAVLDDTGNANIKVAISPNDLYGDSDLLVRTNVTNQANETISKTFTVPYFHSRKYFGIKSPGYFLDVKKPAKFLVVAAAPDGKALDTKAKVSVIRTEWNCVWEDWGYRGSYQCKDNVTNIVDKVVQLTAAKPFEVEFTPDKGGSYQIVVEGENDKDEVAAAAQQLYAWGDGGGSWMSSDSLKFDVVTDKKEYKAGDTATLILQTDLKEATGLVTIERDGVIEKRIIKVTPTEKHITVPITANMAPNVYVSVALVQGRMGDGDRGKPRMRMGIANLTVRPEDNRLTVSVESDKKDYRPGEKVTATVKVVDMAGQPVSAEVSITAADEGVLSLIGYETPDPVPAFYMPWGLAVTSATQYEFVKDIPGPNVERPATGGDAVGTVRSRFTATAVWSPGAVTNAQGIATVTFTAPDNLTAFRMMAVAADKGYRFGSADKRFTVSKPLQLHQLLPRFVSLGDGLQGGVVVHNETGKAGTATVKLVADKLVTVNGPAEKTVQVGVGARVPVTFDLVGTELGTSALTFSVSLNGETDAVKLSVPVLHPSPLRSLAVGADAAKDEVKLPLALPANAVPGTAEVVITVDPDGLAGIEEGLEELIEYPYGCLEQTTSRVIPMLAVRDLGESLGLAAFKDSKELESFVKAGIAKIGRHQTAYGGFSLWPGGEPEAYYTAYGLWGLHLASKAGYPVDKQRIEDALEYLRTDAKNPNTERPYYDEHGDKGSQAFALYVRAVLGDKSATADATALATDKDMPFYGKAFLARALAAGLGAKDPAVGKLVAELSATALAATGKEALIDEPSNYELDYYMSSSLRTSAMVLAALVELDPKNAAIPGLVRVVMKNRRSLPYWDTQENMYGLLALTSYARTTNASGSSVAIEVGGQNVLSATLSGKQRMRMVRVPLAAASELKIVPKGSVHYNAEIVYRQTLDTLKAESAGITFTQEYLDEAGSKPKTAFQVGDVVVVRLKVNVKNEAEHLMVSAAIPAGFEALNTRLATVGGAGVKQTEEWGTFREMKDDRVNYAAEWSSQGEYVYEFSMRAIAAGKFARPPSVAELMYEPEVRGQTAADWIEIKAK